MKKGIHQYRDATLAVIKNKRVVVKQIDEKVIRLHFVRKVDEGEDPEAVPCFSCVVRGKVRHTYLNISREAAQMLFEALYHELHIR